DGSDDLQRLGRHVGIRIAAADAAGLARPRVVAAALVLVGAALLRYYEIPPVSTWLYVLAWYPTLRILDQLVVLLEGESVLARPRALITMLWWSAVIWFLFEAINIRLQDWYYVFLPVNPLERWAGITLSLATAVPAVLLPERVLDRLGVWRQLHWRPIAVGPEQLRGASRLGWAALAATLAFPRYLHPLTWGAVWLIAEPLLARAPHHRAAGAVVGAVRRARAGGRGPLDGELRVASARGAARDQRCGAGPAARRGMDRRVPARTGSGRGGRLPRAHHTGRGAGC